jgi:hypothetical protein
MPAINQWFAGMARSYKEQTISVHCVSIGDIHPCP